MRRHVRPAAQVDEPGVAVEGRMRLRHRGRVLVGADLARGRRARHRICRGVVDDLQLERVVGEDDPRLIGADLVADERLSLGDDLPHPCLYPLEVVRVEGAAAGQVEVVVEAVLDRRADAERGPWEQVEDRLREHVRGGVPDGEQAAFGLGGDDGDLGPVAERRGQVALFAVDDRDHRRLGQTRSDGDGEITRGGAGGHRSRRPVRQPDGDLVGHGRTLPAAPEGPELVLRVRRRPAGSTGCGLLPAGEGLG